MEIDDTRRRDFLKGGLATLALGALPELNAFAQTVPTRRLEWAEFRWNNNGGDYNALCKGIQVMRANTDVNDPMSWAYWSSVHKAYCPHSVAYFMAWHRGYLYYFEQQLRKASGNNNWSIPYWDYYQHPGMPPQFLDTTSPLYIAGRVNTNVYQALTLTPFSSQYVDFPRGTTYSYEAGVEYKPHNPVHNIIGGYMADMQSPMDPIFWLHHASIDRLWAAWVAAGGGRTMPDPASPYWSGAFTYATNLSIDRSSTMSTTGLGYTYSSLALPNSIPPQALLGRGRIVRAQMQSKPPQRILSRPALKRLASTAPRRIEAKRRSVGGVKEFALDEISVSASIPLNPEDSNAIRSVTGSLQKAPFSNGKAGQQPAIKSVRLVFENLRVTDSGRRGGYFYNIFMDLPASVDADTAERSYLVGTLGPFEISGATHHGKTSLELPLTEMLSKLPVSVLKEMTISFVRVSGNTSPKGPAILVGEARIDLISE